MSAKLVPLLLVLAAVAFSAPAATAASPPEPEFQALRAAIAAAAPNPQPYLFAVTLAQRLATAGYSCTAHAIVNVVGVVLAEQGVRSDRLAAAFDALLRAYPPGPCRPGERAALCGVVAFLRAYDRSISNPDLHTRDLARVIAGLEGAG